MGNDRCLHFVSVSTAVFVETKCQKDKFQNKFCLSFFCLGSCRKCRKRTLSRTSTSFATSTATFLSQCLFHVYAPSARLITPCMESAPGNTRDCVLGRLLRFPPQQLWAREGYVAPICTKQVNCKMHVVHIQSHLQSSSFFFERSCAIERFNR